MRPSFYTIQRIVETHMEPLFKEYDDDEAFPGGYRVDKAELNRLDVIAKGISAVNAAFAVNQRNPGIPLNSLAKGRIHGRK